MAEIKPVNNLNRIKLSEVVPLEVPFSAYVFPTTFCNFKCVYCAHSLGHEKMREKYDFEPQTMTLNTYTKIIEQFKEFPRPLKLLSLTGQGEPLINKSLPEMIRLAKEAGVADRIEIISNASLLTNEKTIALVDAGLDCLRVSLQGITAQKYKEMCGWDMNYDMFLSELTFFYEYGRGKCEFFLKVMDVSLNAEDENTFYSIFDNISDRMYIEKCRNAYEGVKFTENMREETLGRWGNVHDPFAICPLSFFQVGIFPDGDVVPCDTIYKPIVLGNVHSETLKSMYSGEKLYKFQIEQLKNKRYKNSKCAVCTAPDDVSLPIDRLDDAVNEIFSRMLLKRNGDLL